MLCDVVINCPSQSSVWGDGQLPGTGSSNLLIFIILGAFLVFVIAVVVFFAVRKNGGPKGPRAQNIYGVSTNFNSVQNTGIIQNTPPTSPGAPPPPPKF